MKKSCLFLLAAAMAFVMCGCDLSDLMPGGFQWLPEFPGNETTPPSAFAPTAEPTTAPPQPTAQPLLWDPAVYEGLILETAEAYGDTPDNCYYLLYDITCDDIPELVITTATAHDDACLRIYTQEDGESLLLESYEQICGMPCGYHNGDGLLLCDMTHPDSINYVMLITHDEGGLCHEVVLDHYEFIKNRFTPLDTWPLGDLRGLAWQANPKDTNASALEVLRKEEIRLHTNLLDTLSREELRRMNIFLSNFSEQDMDNLSFFYPYDYLYFVYNYCTINRTDLLSYSGGYVYITLDSANHVLNQYFDQTFVPEDDDMRFTDGNGGEILYQDGKLRYKPGTERAYSYVTVVTEVIEGRNGGYDVTFLVYSVQGHAPDKYYSLHPREVSNYPEMTPAYWGYATIKDYVRTNGTPSYQLLSYTPVKY